MRFVEDVLARPRITAAPVSYDFWRHFKLAEELEEIRQVRPAAFRALPVAPEDHRAVADLAPSERPGRMGR